MPRSALVASLVLNFFFSVPPENTISVPRSLEKPTFCVLCAVCCSLSLFPRSMKQENKRKNKNCHFENKLIVMQALWPRTLSTKIRTPQGSFCEMDLAIVRTRRSPILGWRCMSLTWREGHRSKSPRGATTATTLNSRFSHRPYRTLLCTAVYSTSRLIQGLRKRESFCPYNSKWAFFLHLPHEVYPRRR